MKRYIILFTGLVVGFYFLPASAQVPGVEITPHVIDEKAKARDILEYKIKLKNNKATHAFIYPVVNDVNPEEGRQDFGEPANLDNKTSLARWVRISRGRIDLAPGEEKDIPLRIEVNLAADPGMRHAVISFAEAQDGYTAESMAKTGVPTQTMINLEIFENIVEKAQLLEFKSDRNTFFKPPVNFSLTIKNIGNKEIAPSGYIYLYNRNGVEIDKLKISEDAKIILPDTVLYYAPAWNNSPGMGKYRAKLELEYGNTDTRDLQDTLYFWIIPYSFLALVGGGTMLLIVILSIILFKRTYRHHLPEIKTSDGVIDLKER